MRWVSIAVVMSSIVTWSNDDTVTKFDSKQKMNDNQLSFSVQIMEFIEF